MTILLQVKDRVWAVRLVDAPPYGLESTVKELVTEADHFLDSPMKSSVTIQDLGETAVAHCVGRVVVGETDVLRQAVLSQVTRRTVVLDLARVDAIDGGGIGLLAFLAGWARALGVDLQLPSRKLALGFRIAVLRSVRERKHS